jgi:hypothetical protein
LKKYLQSEGMLSQQNSRITNTDPELQIKTLLQNAPRRDADKLKALLRSKEREKQQKATEDIADA